MTGYSRLTQCLACGNPRLQKYLDLGEQPLANSCHDGTTVLAKFPLETCVCPQCWHSQLSIAVDRDQLFKNYLYVSGTTRTLREYFIKFVRQVEETLGRPA